MSIPPPRRAFKTPLLLALGLATTFSIASGLIPSSAPETPPANAADRDSARQPSPDLVFIENRGQANDRVAFYVQDTGRSVYFTSQGWAQHLSERTAQETRTDTVKVVLQGAADSSLRVLEKANGVVSYFKGKPRNWQTDIPTARAIVYHTPWPGIDLQFRGQGSDLQAEFVVSAHADPRQIRLRYKGAEDLALDDRGNLWVRTSAGTLTETAPVARQGDTTATIAGRFRLVNDDTVALELDAYDHGRPLVIRSSSAVAAGPTGDRAAGQAMASDAAGNHYRVRNAMSTASVYPDPTQPAFAAQGEDTDVVVSKFDKAGRHVYTAVIGGSEDDHGLSVAVDRGQGVYVTGYTRSPSATFPTVGGPDLTYNGNGDAFIVRLDSMGRSLTFSGYIGDSGPDVGTRVAVDRSGHAFVEWYTVAEDEDYAVGHVLAGALRDDQHLAIAKVSPQGSAVVYSAKTGEAEVAMQLFRSLFSPERTRG